MSVEAAWRPSFTENYNLFLGNYLVIKVVEKSGHPDFPPVRSHRAQLRQWAQDRTVHSEKIGVIPFTFVDVIH